MADDFTAVPAEQWWRVRETVRDLNVLTVLCWAALILLVAILFRKGILSPADFRLSGG